MTTKVSWPQPLGWRVWGFGIALIGATNLALGDFDPLQGVPSHLPARWLIVWLANGFLVLSGAAMQWARTARAAALAIALYYGLAVTVLMNGPRTVANIAIYGAWFGVVTPLALTAAGTILAVHSATEVRWTRVAQMLFALCALFYGGAHFVYLSLTVPLVPAWLPPSRLFWAYATGAAHLLAGIAILTGVRARLAAILLTIMYGSFTFLVHLPLIIGDPYNAYHWTENAMNVALTGVAWVLADSLGPLWREARGAP